VTASRAYTIPVAAVCDRAAPIALVAAVAATSAVVPAAAVASTSAVVSTAAVAATSAATAAVIATATATAAVTATLSATLAAAVAAAIFGKGTLRFNLQAGGGNGQRLKTQGHAESQRRDCQCDSIRPIHKLKLQMMDRNAGRRVTAGCETLFSREGCI